MLPGFADAFQHLHSVELGQHEIEEYGVIRVGFRQKKALLAIGCHINGIAGSFTQRTGDVLCQPGLVLDDQYAHGGLILANLLKLNDTAPPIWLEV